MKKFFERYIIEEKKGEGASAVVFLGKDSYTNKKVAMKVAHTILAKHAKFSSRWQREVILLHQLQHKRIVPLLDAQMKSSERLCMVMGFATQGDLEQKLLKGSTAQDALQWLLEALEGLAHVHSFGVVHQDIKPDNILINDEGHVWLADFSVARTRAEMISNRQEITGTPEYYSPEQRAKLATEVGPWSDLYAWGKILEQVLQSLGYRSGELAKIVEGCLALDPKQRFQSAGEVIPLLQQSIESLPKKVRQTKFYLKSKPRSVQVMKEGFSLPDDVVPIWRRGEVGVLQDFNPRKEEPKASLSLLCFQPPSFPFSDMVASLWKLAEEVLETEETRVAFLVSKKGCKVAESFRRFSRYLYRKGIMDSVMISYQEDNQFDAGYRRVVQELLAPWSEEREAFVQRLKRWLAKEKQVPQKSVIRESRALAKWCGFLDSNEATVDDGLGLVYLFQHLQHRAWKGGVALFLDHPEFCDDVGDGIDICETMLSEVFGKRPMFIVAHIDEDALEERAELKEKVSLLCKMGASLIQVAPPTDDDLIEHLEQACFIPHSMREEVLRFCQSRVDYADFLIQYLAYEGRMDWDDKRGMFTVREGISLVGKELFWSHFETVFATITNKTDALEALAVMVCCPEPVEQLIVNAVSANGLQSLLQVGLLRQEERNIYFTYPAIKEGLVDWLTPQLSFVKIQEQIAQAWMELSERWQLRYDLRIGRAWLLAGDAQKALSYLQLAIRDAREQHRWALVRSIAHLIQKAALQTSSRSAQIEAKLNLLEVFLAQNKLIEAKQQLDELTQFNNLNQQALARLAVLRAEFLVHQKDWIQANKELQSAQKIFSEIRDLQGLARAFMRQGYLLFLLSRLEASVDRFSQAMNLSSKDSLDWAESQARLIELRLRLGWTDGLAHQIDQFWKITQDNSDVHHMAYATYSAGLLLLSQGRRKEAVVRLQTSRALAVSCGDEELEAQSLENLGWLYFLDEDWTKARQLQRRLVYFYQLRQKRDRRRVATIRYRVAIALDAPKKKLWQMDIQQLEKSFVHVQYWWWIFQMLHPSNTEEQIKEYWRKAGAVSQPKIWDISLYKALEKMKENERFSSISDEIGKEIQLRFKQHAEFFTKNG